GACRLRPWRVWLAGARLGRLAVDVLDAALRRAARRAHDAALLRIGLARRHHLPARRAGVRLLVLERLHRPRGRRGLRTVALQLARRRGVAQYRQDEADGGAHALLAEQLDGAA